LWWWWVRRRGITYFQILYLGQPEKYKFVICYPFSELYILKHRLLVTHTVT
jgi:hypothetical protein